MLSRLSTAAVVAHAMARLRPGFMAAYIPHRPARVNKRRRTRDPGKNMAATEAERHKAMALLERHLGPYASISADEPGLTVMRRTERHPGAPNCLSRRDSLPRHS